MQEDPPIVGVLALQGAFREHITMLTKIGVNAVEVRASKDLSGLDGVIIPGGESTTVSFLSNTTDLFCSLKNWVHQRKMPTWGTCAGLILLSENILSAAPEQSAVGGLNISCQRNYYGSQLASFCASVKIIKQDRDFPGVFIRAPAILDIDVDSAQELAWCFDQAGERQTVAVRQDNILGTTFHPELTNDLYWHEYFINMVEQKKH